MKVLILAAGRGSRLKNLTNKKPKCLVEIAGRSLLDWQIQTYKKVNINDIKIVTGYRSEEIKKKGFETFFNSRWLITNMIRSLLTASNDLLKHTHIITYSDIVYNEDIIKKLIPANGDIVITYDLLWKSLWKKRFENPIEDAESFKIENNQLVEIGQKLTNISDAHGQYMGLLKITPKGFKSILKLIKNFSSLKVDKLDMTSLLQLLLKNKIEIKTLPINGKWCEVDSDKDLKIYDSLLKVEKRWSHDWR